MKLQVVFVVVVLLLLANVSGKSLEDKKKEAAFNSAKILTDLYVVIRNIAFPKSPLTDDVTSNRFVMSSPGKVLNYWDYYPGPDYEHSLLRDNNSAPEAIIPPAVMEKWFDIADTMVGADPFIGGVSAKSMARVYEMILSGIEVSGLEKKTSQAQAKYNQAMAFLNSQTPDPENLSVNMTLLSLYTRYQDEYAQRKLVMEEQISKARKTSSYLEYELWFQRNYPSLNSRVNGAYTKWLIFGKKELVELYKAYAGTGLSGTEVEEARMALRASAVRSLDRTRTIYPVSFEPGNWYKYLLPK